MAGISPKKFLQYVTKESVLERLEHGRSLPDAAYGAGLSGPGGCTICWCSARP
jgi:AraC family transcriptional regulator of adaptative response/methylated-DNA-[protein]-cysteine methyltransferase